MFLYRYTNFNLNIILGLNFLFIFTIWKQMRTLVINFQTKLFTIMIMKVFYLLTVFTQAVFTQAVFTHAANNLESTRQSQTFNIIWTWNLARFFVMLSSLNCKKCKFLKCEFVILLSIFRDFYLSSSKKPTFGEHNSNLIAPHELNARKLWRSPTAIYTTLYWVKIIHIWFWGRESLQLYGESRLF